MSPPNDMRQDRDLVLPPGTFAYVLDQTKGHVTVYSGPTRTSLSNTDQLVKWTGKRFIDIIDMDEAVQPFSKATESQYVVLTDPAAMVDGELLTPSPGTNVAAEKLDAGKKIVIPGPAQFALWPGQTAEVIDGHHLSYNEYLVVQVYEPAAANANAAIAAPAGEASETDIQRSDFTMGERMVIRGTDYSYYVPPTGIEVVPERDESGKRSYVQSAATLEQLEYCVLVDENGSKRYERGPAVVFPAPTETFVAEKGSRKFRAIELNPQSGLYVKVIAPYTDSKGKEHAEGDEIFVTGSDTPIYFPRPEHSVIQYGNQRKHHAVAVPAGEGRYVLNRETGEVVLETGPQMLLPDPRNQVVVRRILDSEAVQMLYPGNAEALNINAQWSQELAGSSEEFLPMAAAATGQAGSLARSYHASTTFAGEQMKRGTEHTPPRTITLDTKYQGAVAVSVWPGYAVLVMDKSGKRRVETGPCNILLEYDETLAALTLSTGTPKTSQRLLKTTYLRTINNQVSDAISVETSDLIPVGLRVSYRVNFEGEGEARTRWFDVEDYVKTLTDHCRSRLRSAAKRFGVQDFQAKAVEIVRDTLLGDAQEGGRDGLAFPDNGMRLVDVEVLGVEIGDASVAGLLAQAMSDTLTGTIELTRANQRAELQAELELLERKRINMVDQTNAARAAAELAQVERDRESALARVETDVTVAGESGKLAELHLVEERNRSDQNRELLSKANEVQLAMEQGRHVLAIEHVTALQGQFADSLKAFTDAETAARVVEAVAPAAAALGITSAELIEKFTAGSPVAALVEPFTRRPLGTGYGNPND